MLRALSAEQAQDLQADIRQILRTRGAASIAAAQIFAVSDSDLSMRHLRPTVRSRNNMRVLTTATH